MSTYVLCKPSAYGGSDPAARASGAGGKDSSVLQEQVLRTAEEPL